MRSLESDLVNVYKANPNVSASKLNKLNSYNENMDTFSKLKTLEDELATTAAKKGESIFTLKDMIVGGAGTILMDAGTGGLSTVSAVAIRHALSPKGKMIIKRLSEKLRISQANVKKLVKNGKIPASMLTAGEVIGDK